MAQALTDEQRKLIHDLALDARRLLTREARELLEGTYGLYADGRLDPPEKLPQVQADPETGETYRRLAQFLEDEERAGLARTDAVDKLVKEVAFTHLNWLVAFKMMEARGLIRGTLDKGTDSNGFKYYLADREHADDLARYERGDADTAYRHFLLWQAGQVAQEVRVIFDPDTLPSRLFPRPRALNALLDMLNQLGLTDAWRADETIGWVYQYFNEPDLEVFRSQRAPKVPSHLVAAKTQQFTPHWIVRFLVQNTLGRLWVQMHRDTWLVGTEVLDYLVPLEGEVPPEPLRPVREITLLDPACGGMHFGLVAFDLFAAMYQEELDRAGEPGWPETPSVSDPAEIPAAVIKHNLFGIDIDLRAVQLSALALYLKAKSLSPEARITGSNLACADVWPLNGARLGTFLREARFTRPIYERLIRALWERLRDVHQLGSLLRLERELGELITQEREQYEKMPLFAGVDGEFEAEAAEEEFWDIISAQIVQGLDEFARQQAKVGVDQTFFTGEAFKGLYLLKLMLRRYDVVVTNPPYLDTRDFNPHLKSFVDSAYPENKRNLYSAFLERCLEFLNSSGRLGIVTPHTFMFTSHFDKTRQILRDQVAIETLVHTGLNTFSDAVVDVAFYALRLEPDPARRRGTIGVYFRLVKEPTSQFKQSRFEQAMSRLREGADDPIVFRYCQNDFDAIPGSPWVYWISAAVRQLFATLPKLRELAQPRQGLATSDNFRFLRFWWEIGQNSVAFACRTGEGASTSGKRWFPYMKGGTYRKWYGNQEHLINWERDGIELKVWASHLYVNWSRIIKNVRFYFLEGITWTDLSSKGFGVRYLPPGFVFDVKGSSGFPPAELIFPTLAIMNSPWMAFTLGLLNPTVSFQVGDIARVPLKRPDDLERARLDQQVRAAVHLGQWETTVDEVTFEFTAPLAWDIGLEGFTNAQVRLSNLETRINDEVYRLYGTSDEDRAAIEAELAGEPLIGEEDEDAEPTGDEEENTEPEPPMTHEELAVRWISYAVGVVLGRFRPGVRGALGSAVYRRKDFAVGSLPAPDEAEFDQLVGPAERFAYVDEDSGRHRFPAEVEAALRDLALPDGIAVLDEGHPRDLPALVEQALQLMLDWDTDREHVAPNTREVIEIGAGGDLRRFFERHFFTKWHFRWYRKRPVYWPLQSAKRSYGFVLFHEKVDKSTLYVLQRDYLDHKLNGLRLQIGDLRGRAEPLSGAARKRVERQMDRATQQLDEITEFAATMEQIVRAGYEPEPDWIDDGVILRMAPLWELIPIWKSEPKKYWERLQRGDYDWSHIAMRYWPERVRNACGTNKSFAIAHGHEEWYGG
ncbi:MAG: BREX-1 system adenine-specific DNA-methyltransferase PglX [Chloroflexota bacterium]|nr:BREX-1 system adenine-specific DNA-methyltransferase PglX [Chloroflexota bacterium]